MPETNFLTPLQELNKKSAKAKTPRKKSQKKTLRISSASGEALALGKSENKPAIKSKDNLNIKPAMPKTKLKVEEIFLPEPKGEARKIYRKIAFSFVVLTVILAAAVLYFGFSKVTLVIIPVQEKITDSLNLEIIDKDSGAAIGQGQIRGVVRQVPVEQVRTFAAGGKEILGEEVSGKVTIINNYLKNQPLVASTRLLAPDNKLFRLKNTVNVPAGGQVEVEVYADEARPDMAIGPSKFTVPGLWAGLQDKIYAESRTAMKYSEKIKYTIKQGDIDGAVSELKKDLLANAEKEVGKAYLEYDQSLFKVDNNSVTQDIQGKVGEEKEKFTIKMKTMVTVVAFKGDDVYKQAEEKLAATLADDREIVDFNRPETVYGMGSFNLSQGTAVVNTNFTARVTLKGSAGIIKKNNLTGLSLDQLKAYLNSLPQVAGYEIKFFPSFIKKIPNLVDRIEIVIKK